MGSIGLQLTVLHLHSGHYSQYALGWCGRLHHVGLFSCLATVLIDVFVFRTGSPISAWSSLVHQLSPTSWTWHTATVHSMFSRSPTSAKISFSVVLSSPTVPGCEGLALDGFCVPGVLLAYINPDVYLWEASTVICKFVLPDSCCER
jgi:hypothetical protein